MIILKSRFCTLRNHFYNDMDPLHPMGYQRLVSKLDMNIYPQDKWYNNEVISEWKGIIEKNLCIEYGFLSGTRSMGIL